MDSVARARARAGREPAAEFEAHLKLTSLLSLGGRWRRWPKSAARTLARAGHGSPCFWVCFIHQCRPTVCLQVEEVAAESEARALARAGRESAATLKTQLAQQRSTFQEQQVY